MVVIEQCIQEGGRWEVAINFPGYGRVAIMMSNIILGNVWYTVYTWNKSWEYWRGHDDY